MAHSQGSASVWRITEYIKCYKQTIFTVWISEPESVPEGICSGKQMLQPIYYSLFQVSEECLFWQ